MLLKRKKKKRKPPLPRVGCPFCWEWLQPKQLYTGVFSGDGCLGGVCDECGAFFVFDVIGKAGGQVLLDVQALACAGDLDRALTLKEGEHYKLKTKTIQEQSGPFGQRNPTQSFLRPKVWAIQLIDKHGTATE